MGSTNFHLAPPPTTVDALLAVPIDIQSINAFFTFDGATETSSADATITYIVGPAGRVASLLGGVIGPVSGALCGGGGRLGDLQGKRGYRL